MREARRSAAPRQGAHEVRDVLRGIAILAILPANIPFIALPVDAESPAPDAGLPYLAYQTTRFLIDYKFITIFCLLFGIGLGWMQRGDPPVRGPVVRRLLVLWALGIAHATLLWYGDVVSYYAPLGLLAMWAATLAPRKLLIAGAILVGLPVLVMIALLPVLVVLDSLFPGLGSGWSEAIGPTEPMSWSGFWRGLSEFDATFEASVYRHGSFLQVVALRTLAWMFGGLVLFPYFGPRILGIFLVGLAAARQGWILRPEQNRGAFVRLALAGASAGLPLQALACVAPHAWGGLSARLAGEILQYVGSLGMAALYVGALGLLFARARGARVWLPFEAAGRMAFTCYLGQSFMCGLIFYSHGLALFGTLDRWDLLYVVILVWAAELVMAPVWLMLFRMGPVEWLWRSAAYARPMPMRYRRRGAPASA